MDQKLQTFTADQAGGAKKEDGFFIYGMLSLIKITSHLAYYPPHGQNSCLSSDDLFIRKNAFLGHRTLCRFNFKMILFDSFLLLQLFAEIKENPLSFFRR